MDTYIGVTASKTGNFATIARALSAYAPDFLGLRYDSGHGNITGDGLNYLELLRDRLIALHLNDNDGGDNDQHMPLFSGTVDWERLAIIARSAYTKCISMEVSLHQSGFTQEIPFLNHVFGTGTRFAQMVKRAKSP